MASFKPLRVSSTPLGGAGRNIVSIQNPFLLLTEAAVALPIVTTIVVALRLWLRHNFKIALKVDDYLIVLSLPFVWGVWGTWYYMSAYILTAFVTAASFPSFIKASWALDFLYLNGLSVVKFSILFFYLRALGTTKRTRFWIYVLFAFIGAYAIVRFFTNIFQCVPFSYFWDRSIDGQCIDGRAAIIALQSLHWLTEILLLLFPLPIICRLSLPTRTKVGIALLFLLGLSTCAASALRLYYLYTIEELFQNHPLRVLEDTSVQHLILVDLIEISLGVICATLPAVRSPVLDILQSLRCRMSRKRNGSSSAPLDDSSYAKDQLEKSDPDAKAMRTSVTEVFPQLMDEKEDSLKDLRVDYSAHGPRQNRFCFPDDQDEDEISMPLPLIHPRRGSIFA